MNYTDEEQITLEYVFTNEKGEEIEKVLIISSKDLENALTYEPYESTVTVNEFLDTYTSNDTWEIMNICNANNIQFAEKTNKSFYQFCNKTSSFSIDSIHNNVYNRFCKGRVAMPKTAREIVKILKSNGFKKTGQTGSHAKFYNSKTKRTVVVPIHNGDVPLGTEANIWKQAGL